jgi:hypothetical protein
LEGNLALPLQQIDEAVEAVSANGGLSEFERVLLGDLEHISIRMQRVMGKSCDPRVKSRSFFAQAHLWCAAISSRAGAFIQSINELHDRSRQA